MNRQKAIFNTFCVVTAVALILWKIYEYNYSEADVIKINFQSFNNDRNRPYPSLTLCFDGTANPNIDDTSNQNLPRANYFALDQTKHYSRLKNI